MVKVEMAINQNKNSSFDKGMQMIPTQIKHSNWELQDLFLLWHQAKIAQMLSVVSRT